MNKYPRISNKKKETTITQKGDDKPCVCCEKKTTGKVVVEVNYMRGDDEVEHVCNNCQKSPNEDILKSILESWERIEL